MRAITMPGRWLPLDWEGVTPEQERAEYQAQLDLLEQRLSELETRLARLEQRFGAPSS